MRERSGSIAVLHLPVGLGRKVQRVARSPIQGLIVGCIVLGLTGCGGFGILKRGPSDQDLVTQVMRQWVAGWGSLDADLLGSLLSDDYSGANGESKNDLLLFVRKWKENPQNKVTFTLEGAQVQVNRDQATVRGVRASVNVSDKQTTGGQYSLDYFLKKEEAGWRITGAVVGR